MVLLTYTLTPPPTPAGTLANTANPLSNTPWVPLRELVSPVGEDGSPNRDGQFDVIVTVAGGDPVWAARALNARGLVYLEVGSPSRADGDFAVAERLFAETRQDLEWGDAALNRGLTAFRVGDLPAALSYLDEAASRYRPLNVPTPGLSIDRCGVLLAAGLVSDALAEADTAIRDIEQTRGRSTKKAELLLMAAN